MSISAPVTTVTLLIYLKKYLLFKYLFMFYLLIDSFFFQIILTTKTFQKRKGSVNECLEINRTATVRSYAAVHGSFMILYVFTLTKE